MSKRFGRNQRRRAREALAQAHAELQERELASRETLRGAEMALVAYIEARDKLKEAEDFMREVASIVGRESIIAGEPTPLMVGMTKDEAASYGIGYSPRAEVPTFDITATDMSIEQMRYEILTVLDVKAVRDVMRACVNLRVTFSDKTIGYTLSQMAIARMTKSELHARLAPEIAHDISRALVNEIKGGR